MSPSTWRGIDIPILPTTACATADPDLFHPAKITHRSAAAAKQICAACPALTPCLQYAVEHDERQGIWGCTTPRERTRIRQQVGQGIPFPEAAADTLPACPSAPRPAPAAANLEPSRADDGEPLAA